jgi:hypothetical protein
LKKYKKKKKTNKIKGKEKIIKNQAECGVEQSYLTPSGAGSSGSPVYRILIKSFKNIIFNNNNKKKKKKT